jgi:hypothetical protein
MIILSVLAISHCQPVAAQKLAINAYTATHLPIVKTSAYDVQQIKKHCNAVRVGEVLMISGGAVVIAGGINLATLSTGPNGDLGTGGLFAYMVIGAGGIVMVGGIMVFIIGEVHDHQHKPQRVTIIGKRNEVGLAYNF